MSNALQKVTVGLIMPIASIENCSAEHWIEVKSIITESLEQSDRYNFETKLVSESESVGLIHKRIVHGIYTSDIVICDVSCKNPNVMFELGMRLAFDKPTVIIKDDQTTYSFDTSGIEHIDYPRDLRFTKIVEFKSELLRKVVGTYEDSLQDPEHSPFLKSFGQFKVAKLDEKEVAPYDLILDKLSELDKRMNFISQLNRPNVKKYGIKEDALKSIHRAVNNYLNTINPSSGVNKEELFNFVNTYLRSSTNYGFPKLLLEQEVIEYLKQLNWDYY